MKCKTATSLTNTLAFHLPYLYTSFPLVCYLFPRHVMFTKFCFFKVTAWITFALFKAALRSRVKLAPSEQALLFKSKRCSNVLAILSHSRFPHGAPTQAAPRSCVWTQRLPWSQLTEREEWCLTAMKKNIQRCQQMCRTPADGAGDMWGTHGCYRLLTPQTPPAAKYKERAWSRWKSLQNNGSKSSSRKFTPSWH